jgi:hypothetical protein
MYRAINEIIITEMLEIGFGGKGNRRKYRFSPPVSWKSRRSECALSQICP